MLRRPVSNVHQFVASVFRSSRHTKIFARNVHASKDWRDKEPHLLPAKHLSARGVKTNLCLSLADAPFSKEDPTLNLTRPTRPPLAGCAP